jgi:hypothetical protein
MIGYYLATLSRAFMQGVADFGPDYAGNYFLPRETRLSRCFAASDQI